MKRTVIELEDQIERVIRKNERLRKERDEYKRTMNATEEEIQQALQVVEKLLRKRMGEHGIGKFASIHEALGVLTEEYHETLEAVRSNNRDEFLDEMLDCAISGIWAYVSLNIAQDVV